MKNKTPVNIFEFKSLNSFLKKWCEVRKSIDPFFHSDKFLELATSLHNKHSHNPNELLYSYIRLLHLNPAESEYLDLLIQIDFEKKPLQRQFLIEKLNTFQKEKLQSTPTSKWYFSALWNALNLCSEPWNEEEILSKISPKLQVSELHDAMDTLIELKLVEKTATGYKLLKGVEYAAPPEIEKTDIFSEIDQIAGTAMQRLPQDRRPSYTHMFPISLEGITKIEALMDGVRSELNNILDTDQGNHEVCLFHWQLLPIFRFNNPEN